jgi:Uma2 family endonuclease
VYASDFLVEVSDCEKFVYPDVTVVCEQVKLRPDKRKGLDVLLNPSIIIEVLSESTEKDDRGEKFECYKTLPSLKTYVLVSSKKILVEVFERTPGNHWLLKTEKDTTKNIQIGDCQILVEEIYNKVVFESQRINV